MFANCHLNNDDLLQRLRNVGGLNDDDRGAPMPWGVPCAETQFGEYMKVSDEALFYAPVADEFIADRLCESVRRTDAALWPLGVGLVPKRMKFAVRNDPRECAKTIAWSTMGYSRPRYHPSPELGAFV